MVWIVGPPENPYGAFGLDEWSARERAERLEEQAQVLDRLLRGERVTWQGRHYPVKDATPPAPVQRPRPPFVVAAHGDRALQVAARHADGWNSLGGQPYRLARDPSRRLGLAGAVEQTRRLSVRLDEYCQQFGREPATLRRSVLAYWPAPDPLSSVDAFDEYVGRYHEIGIDELIFYWPPLENIRTGAPLSAEQWTRFERIATERVARDRAHAQPTG